MSKPTKANIAMHVFNRCLEYNRIELVLLVLLIVGNFSGGIWAPLLWFGFVGTVIWIFVSSWRSAELEMFQGLRDRELYLSDFMSGFLVYVALAITVRHEAPQFWIIYWVAAIQYLRYTALAYKCLMAERKFNEQEKNNKVE